MVGGGSSFISGAEEDKETLPMGTALAGVVLTTGSRSACVPTLICEVSGNRQVIARNVPTIIIFVMELSGPVFLFFQPCLLLNPSLPEVRPRMYPVFFGESIEVSPEPVQEIRYRWVWVGWRGFLSFSRCSSFCGMGRFADRGGAAKFSQCRA